MAIGTLDFNSQKGIADILRLIRESTAEDAEKNDLRDLVFSYVRSGGDKELLTTLTQRIHSLPRSTIKHPPVAHASAVPSDAPPTSPETSISQETNEAAPTAPAAAQPTATTQPATVGFGVVRAVPSFASSQPATAAAAASAPQPAPVPAAPGEGSVATAQAEAPSPVTNEAAVAQPAAPSNAAPATPPPAPEPVAPSTPPTPSVVSPVAPAVPESATPLTPVAATAVESGDMLNRIRQIKAEINAAVGNPVHLMDDGNPIGREYMQTLLQAMKIAGGAQGSANEVMTKLESLRSQILEAAANTAVAGATPSAPVAAQAAAPAAPQSQVAPAAPQTPPQPTPTVAQPVAPQPIPDQSVSTPASPTADLPERPAPAAPSTPQSAEQPAPAFQQTPATPATAVAPASQTPTPTPAAPVAAPVPPTPPAPEPVATQPTPPATNTVPPTPPTAPASGSLSSLASVLESSAAAMPAPEPVPQPTAPADPLLSQDVTNGLERLLSEWSLFKSSGLFGTGPSGREHPLYVQLAGLPMVSIVSGRFEGATKEVRQSITDYMNGWRYEQGLLHENTETFEHYLRRVVHHILSSQKKSSAA